MTKQQVIGSNSTPNQPYQLPWHIPEDLAHFKLTTLHKPVIMGRKTFESLKKPLPNRFNIVLSKSLPPSTGYHVVDSIAAAVQLATQAAAMQLATQTCTTLPGAAPIPQTCSALQNQELAVPQQNCPEIMIIGGAQIYREFLPLTDRMYISLIHYNYPGNILFPEYNMDAWNIISETAKTEFTIKILQRK